MSKRKRKSTFIRHTKASYRWRNLRTESHLYGKDGLGWIYIGKLGMDNLYKIGYAVDCKQRERDLQASNPHYRNVYVVQVNDRRKAERIIHLALRKQLDQRELFRLCDGEAEALYRAIKETMWINKEEYPSPSGLRKLWMKHCATQQATAS